MLMQIDSVDHNGYNGRQYHPENTDIGLVVLVVGCDVRYFGADFESFNLMDGGTHGWVLANDEAKAAAAYAIDDHEDANLEICWTCVTKDGRTLELMDHEVSVFRS